MKPHLRHTSLGFFALVFSAMPTFGQVGPTNQNRCCINQSYMLRQRAIVLSWSLSAENSCSFVTPIKVTSRSELRAAEFPGELACSFLGETNLADFDETIFPPQTSFPIVAFSESTESPDDFACGDETRDSEALASARSTAFNTSTGEFELHLNTFVSHGYAERTENGVVVDSDEFFRLTFARARASARTTLAGQCNEIVAEVSLTGNDVYTFGQSCVQCSDLPTPSIEYAPVIVSYVRVAGGLNASLLFAGIPELGLYAGYPTSVVPNPSNEIVIDTDATSIPAPDINRDNEICFDDRGAYGVLFAATSPTDYDPRIDTNLDGVVEDDDRVLFLEILDSLLCPADYNCDGLVDPDDLADFVGANLTTPPAQSTDFIADGTVNPDDLADFISAYFVGC